MEEIQVCRDIYIYLITTELHTHTHIVSNVSKLQRNEELSPDVSDRLDLPYRWECVTTSCPCVTSPWLWRRVGGRTLTTSPCWLLTWRWGTGTGQWWGVRTWLVGWQWNSSPIQQPTASCPSTQVTLTQDCGK